jgi:putative Flp pilus-assembly TadE/G-like protein
MKTLLRRLCREQDGQTLYLVAASMVVILGMAALSIDIGFAMHAQRELQANTDAAASAGGTAMPNPIYNSTTNVQSVVDLYSGQTSSDYNFHNDLKITGVSVSFACVSSSTYPTYNLPACNESVNGSYGTCTSSGASTGCNLIKVVETAQEPTFFAKIFGFGALNLTATSIASAAGNAVPYHIMLVLDTTASMQSTSDPGCLAAKPNNSYTAEQCAQMGAQTLLGSLAPCLSGQTCTNSGITPVDEVGLMVFPGACYTKTLTSGKCPQTPTPALSNTTQTPWASDDYTCSSNPPDPPPSPYNNDPEYLVLPFQTNYRTTDNTLGLNTSSDLAESIGANTWVATDTSNNCGMPGYGGEGTFYAGAIVAAQTYLVNNHTPNVQDIMILLSDGDATASSTEMAGSTQQQVSSGQIAGMNGHLFSATAECTQAVNAATWAKTPWTQSNGISTQTEIYSISYGSENAGCTSGENVPAIAGNPANTPCATMASIASSPLSKYFYKVTQTGQSGSCQGGAPTQKLDQVFNVIAGYLQSSRLVPASFTSATWN